MPAFGSIASSQRCSTSCSSTSRPSSWPPLLVHQHRSWRRTRQRPRRAERQDRGLGTGDWRLEIRDWGLRKQKARSEMRIALVQQHATTDKAANVARGLRAFQEAARHGARVVAFAELAFEPFYPQVPAAAR